MRIATCLLILFIYSLPLSNNAQAESLVSVDDAGQILPGIASKWSSKGGNSGRFVFMLKRDCASVLKKLSEKMPDSEISCVTEGLVIISSEPDKLLKKLSAIDLKFDDGKVDNNANDQLNSKATATKQKHADPFLGVSGLAQTDMPVPDGSSSIRVNALSEKIVSLANQFEAIVIKVEKQQTYPFVVVSIKISVPPASKTAKVTLKKGSVVSLRPFIEIVPGDKSLFVKPNFKNPQTLINTGCWYFKRGDRVVGEVSGQFGKIINVKYLERKQVD